MNYKQAIKRLQRVRGRTIHITRQAWLGWPGVHLGMRRVQPGSEKIVHRIWYNNDGFPERTPWQSSECDRKAADWVLYDPITDKVPAR